MMSVKASDVKFSREEKCDLNYLKHRGSGDANLISTSFGIIHRISPDLQSQNLPLCEKAKGSVNIAKPLVII